MVMLVMHWFPFHCPLYNKSVENHVMIIMSEILLYNYFYVEKAIFLKSEWP